MSDQQLNELEIAMMLAAAEGQKTGNLEVWRAIATIVGNEKMRRLEEKVAAQS